MHHRLRSPLASTRRPDSLIPVETRIGADPSSPTYSTTCSRTVRRHRKRSRIAPTRASSWCATPEAHRQLDIDAAEQHVSLNRLAASRLIGR
ncbi:MAG TPA: toxin-antitoxin system HicB family antitoxin [Microbacteriaceae bacterium]|nr:toxin-antitoxin system HicB family antitoxin [Microbacteriaceae bacterium]